MSDLRQIFDSLKPLLEKYRPPLGSKTENECYFDLWSFKDLVIEGRKRKEVFFAGLIIQKDYVGFYYMPVYVDAEVKQFFSPQFLKFLKGKSCFHIRTLTPDLLAEIDRALQAGFALYQERGWT
ncbi:MAG: DUF1801 domain-containing protein [Chloroflexi bacterium]|nr:DUF1801 domain-containing protein [Chloroflexota bacterium]